MPIHRPRRVLLISVTVLTMLLTLPAATIAQAHKSSSCHAGATTSTTHPGSAKSAARKCAKPAHKAKPHHARHHPKRTHRKHKAKHPAAGTEAEAEEETNAGCEEGGEEASSDESGACEAPEEEQES